MTATEPSRWPAAPPITAPPAIGRDHGHLPGASSWLLAKLYGRRERQAEILAEHLPRLLAAWDEPPAWWFMRYEDPRSHLRLRIALPEAAAFGEAAQQVGAWVARLRREGLLKDVQFATSYPETGRWGGGPLMAAAEEVFGADSRALAVQFAQPVRPHPQALAAANFVAIAAAFTGSTQAGMDWLISYGKIDVPHPVDRAVHTEAVRLADPTENWATLRAAAGGPAILRAWGSRGDALTRYRTCLSGAEGIDPNLVLDSLLHAHHIRAVGIDKGDERVCVRLARAAALAWTNRRRTG